jgi:hypothetical protein
MGRVADMDMLIRNDEVEIERLRAINAEMLAALRLVVDLADNGAVESGDCRNPDNPFVIARAAIKKAETDREQNCPGHVASDSNPKLCGRCGCHIDDLREAVS